MEEKRIIYEFKLRSSHYVLSLFGKLSFISEFLSFKISFTIEIIHQCNDKLNYEVFF